MAEQPSSALTMLTEFFSAEHIEAAARQTGFVQRTSKITGKIFLALVTFGVWGDAKTTLAQLAAKVAQLSQHVAVSPEAIFQRMNKRALAFLQELIRQAFAKLQSCQEVCEENLLTPFARVYIADSTGFELPHSLKSTFPGSGGSAAQAGAKLQLVWDYKSSVFHHFALTPWNTPDQIYIDAVVALARQDDLFIFDLGYFKINALASMAAAHAYFLCRPNHQTTILEAVADRAAPVQLAPFLTTVESHIVQKPILIGVKERVASRLIASRVPEAVINSRRRMARKNAKKKGHTASQAHLALLAWNLFITNVPQTIWQAPTVLRVYPIRWQVETFYQDSKGQLGFNEYRMQSSEAIGKHGCLVFMASSLWHLTCLPAVPDRTKHLIQSIGEACQQQGRALLQQLLVFVHDRWSSGATVDQVFAYLFAKKRGIVPA